MAGLERMEAQAKVDEAATDSAVEPEAERETREQAKTKEQAKTEGKPGTTAAKALETEV